MLVLGPSALWLYNLKMLFHCDSVFSFVFHYEKIRVLFAHTHKLIISCSKTDPYYILKIFPILLAINLLRFRIVSLTYCQRSLEL